MKKILKTIAVLGSFGVMGISGACGGDSLQELIQKCNTGDTGACADAQEKADDLADDCADGDEDACEELADADLDA